MKGTGFWLRAVLVVALLGGGGYLGYHFFLSHKSEAAQLAAGEASYAAGEQAMKADDARTAALRFDEAALQASKTLDAVRKQFATPTNSLTRESGEELRQVEGKALWLRARALRERAYAQAAVDGKTLQEITDSITGQKLRPVLVIPDDKVRPEAFACLRGAAERLSKEQEVQEEALRNELLIAAMNWQAVEIFAKNVIVLDPTNARARYMLARLEFEQPRIRPNEPVTATPLERRQRGRMVTALDHIAEMKKGKDYPLWRTVYLEAQLLRWLQQDDRQQHKEAQAEKYATQLRSLLLDEKDGALARAARGEGLDRVSTWDIDGVFGAHLLALEQTKEDIAATDPPNTARLLKVLDQTLTFCEQVSARKQGKDQPSFVDAAFTGAVAAAALAEPVLSGEQAGAWSKQLARLEALAGQAAKADQGKPAAYAQLSELFGRQAFLATTRGNTEKAAALNKQSRAWVDAGLKVAAARKLPPEQILPLHSRAATVKAVAGSRREGVAEHLAALRASRAGVPLADLLEGAMLEREGRLEKAKDRLEAALAASGPLTLRVHMVLANIYAALGQPVRALNSLRVVEKAYQGFDKLSETEREWALQFTRGPKDLAYTQLVMNLDAARQEAVKLLRKADGKKVTLAGAVKPYEDAALRQLKLIKEKWSRTPHDRAAREALATHYLLTGRDEKAKEMLDGLLRDYPTSLEVLRLDIRYLTRPAARKAADDGKTKSGLPPKLVEAVDQRIKQFLKTSSDEGARLTWAMWLTSTGRSDQAVAYLEDPLNFPAGKDDRHQRVLALALLGKGDRAEGLKLLKHLPHDPSLDAILIRLAGDRKDQTTQIDEAVGRYESNGLFRTWKAANAFGERKYKEAAQDYLASIEFTRFKPLAQAGLQRSLLALAQMEPAEARSVALQMLKEVPDEPALMLPLAYASLQLDDIGSPGESWGTKKTMAAALAMWEQLALRAGHNRVNVLLTQAEFWAAAGRADMARKELARVFKQDDRNAVALILAIELALSTREADALAEAAGHAATLKAVMKDAAPALLLAARVAEEQGNAAEAIKAYENLIARHPNYAPGYSRLFQLLDKEGDKAKARDLAVRWRKQAPAEVLAAHADVYTLASAGKVEEAKRAADTYLAERLKEVEKQLANLKPAPKVDAKEFAKNKQQAADQLRWAIALEMARAFARTPALDEAEARIADLLKTQPKAVAARLLQGDIHLARKDWEKGRDVYAAILKDHPQHFVAGNNLAWLLADRFGKPDEAYQVATTVRQGQFSKKPVTAERLPAAFLDTLGVIYHKLKRDDLYAEMRDLFEAARKRYPHDPRMYLYLGYAQAGLGNVQRAVQLFNAAAALAGPNGRSLLSATQRQEVIQAATAAQKKLKGAG
ncbi:MAG: tetratricopeptide repeat protein [Gemmataceae bacterium]|nr:tetratricopeptide repeat protein [Gemmataceae bacterium]